MSAATKKPTGFLAVLPVKEFFTLDVRSLALFRLVLGMLLLLDWTDRLPDLRAHYSDEGIVPRDFLTGLLPISVHLYHGSVWFQAVLAGIAILFALFVLVGWKTPFACLVSFFLLISVHARNPSLMQGGDHLIRIITFWSIFLPLGACYSLDASRPGRQPLSPRVLSPASFAYVIQVGLVYFFAAAWKWSPEWRGEASAVYLSLHVDWFTTRFGNLLLGMPQDLLRWMTRGTMWVETLGPVLLLLPFNVGLQRLLAVALFICFHLGLALTMELSLFPWVCMAAWLPLLPTSFWDRIQSRLRAGDGLTLVYDPDRSWARDATFALRMWLLLWQAKHEPAEPALAMRLRKQGGWGVLTDGQELTGTEALARLVAASPVYYPLAPLGRTALGRWVVALVGGRGGKSGAAEPVRPGWTPPGGLAVNAVVLFLLTYIVLLNARNFAYTRAQTFPDPARPPENLAAILPNHNFAFGAALGIDQGWGLFAPQPGRFVGWYLAVGIRQDGEHIDLLNGGRPIDDLSPNSKPEAPARVFPNGRWRKMMMNLSAFDPRYGTAPPHSRAYPYLLPGFSRYLYRDWNARHEGKERLRAVEIVYWKEVTVSPDETPPPPERFCLVRYREVSNPQTNQTEDSWEYYQP